VKLVLQNHPRPPLQLAGLRLTLLEVYNRTSKYDVTLTALEESGTLRTWFHYNSDLYSAATMGGIAKRLEAVLRCVVGQPDVRLATIEERLHEVVEEHRQGQVKELDTLRLRTFGAPKRKPVERVWLEHVREHR
jgi:non-ribosomal peptide synthetase component F